MMGSLPIDLSLVRRWSAMMLTDHLLLLRTPGSYHILLLSPLIYLDVRLGTDISLVLILLGWDISGLLELLSHAS